MIRKNSRKRILPLVLAAMLVISDAGYGNLPIIYAQESERQAQENETTDTTEQTTPTVEESTASTVEKEESEESTVPSATEQESEEATQESEPISETSETTEEEASASETGETTTTQDTDESGEETQETLTDEETKTTELAETEEVVETGEEIELLGEERSETSWTGTCGAIGASGENQPKWELTLDGVLTISGVGEMFGEWNISSSRPEWETNVNATKVKIKKVVIENGITKIGGYAFYNDLSRYSELTEVTLPASLKTIDGYAFYNCQQLTTINFSSGLEEIGMYAFSGCQQLTTIDNISDTLQKIGMYAFQKTGLEGIVISNPITTIEEGAFFESNLQNVEITYQNNATVGSSAFSNCVDLNSVVLHGSIASLGDGAFQGCEALSTLSIDNGNGSINIGKSAFSGCVRLTKLEISQNVKTIGEKAFLNCKKLKNVDSIVSKTESIESNAFQNCIALTALTFEGRTSEEQKLVIGGYAFSDCSGLVQVTIPDGTKVGSSAFAGLENLNTVEVGDNAILEVSSFSGCKKLNDVTIGKNATIGNSAFYDCSMKQLTIGNGSAIQAQAFRDCTALIDITLEEGVKEIKEMAFMSCTSLKSIELPASITTIENGIFSSCTNLAEVIFHGKDMLREKDTTQRAFANCSQSLTAWVHPGTEAQDYVKSAKIPYKFIVDKVSFVSDSETLDDLEENATAEVAIQLFPSGEDSTAGSNIVTAARQIEWKSSDETIATITGPESGEDNVTATITAKKAGTCTITAICDGVEASCNLKVVKRVLPVTADPQSGVINADQKVTLSCATEGAVIYYTTDGTEPTKDSTKYETPITLTEDTTIKAFAVSAGYADSTVTEIAYQISKITSVSFAYSIENPLELELGKTAELSLILNPSDAEPRTEVAWESDNTEIVSIAGNSQEGSSVSAVLQANKAGECIVKAVCDGKEASCKVIVKERVQQVEAQEDSDPDADTGKIVSGTKVSLSCSTPGAKIYYTVNNEAELTEKTGISYSAPIVLDEAGTKVIRAIAVKDGWLQSETAEFTYDVAAKVEGISLDETDITLGREEVRSLTVSFQPEDAVPEPITWHSSDSTVASVEQSTAKSAKVTAKKAGTCTITAVCGTFTATCKVTVEDVTRVSKVYAVPEAGAVDPGTEVELKCDTKGAVIYYTVDGSAPTQNSTQYTAAIKIDKDMTIKAIAVLEGYQDSEEAQFAFSVNILVTGITLTPETLTLGREQTEFLKVSFQPANATPQSIVWTSSDPEIAKVKRKDDISAVVTGNKEGKCTITATCGTFTATCEVTVTSEKRVSKVYAIPEAGTVDPGTEVELKCETPGAAIYYTVDGSAPTRNSTQYMAAIKIDKDMTIKAIAVLEGYQDSEEAQFVFTIKEILEDIPVTGITLTPETLTLGREQTEFLKVSFQPANATPQSIVWTSSDLEIAEVKEKDDVSATVTGNKEGKCTITATCGTFTATCEVTVTGEKRVSKVYTIPEAGTVNQGTEVELKCETQGAAIYYTMDGSAPTQNSTQYTAAIKIDKDMTIRAIAVLEGYQDSEEAQFVFSVNIPVTGISLMPETLTLGREETAFLTASFQPANATPQSIIWTSSDLEIAEVKEKDDVSAAVTGNKEGKCTITATCGTFTATCEVTVTGEKRVSQVYSVPASGSVIVPGTEIALKCDTTGARIYYTLDGSAPTMRSTPYARTLTLNEDTIVKAIAVKDGYEDSAVAELSFTVNAVIPDIPEISVPKTGIWTTEIKDQPYTGSAIKPILYVYDGNKLLTEKTDYTLSYKNNKNLGLGQVVIKGKGNYADQKLVSFKIVPKAISDKDIIIEDMAFAADRKSHKVPPTIMHNGKKLKANKDFTVDYGSGSYIEEGTYEITIRGQGNYEGTASGKITIIGKDKLLSKAKIAKIPVQEYQNGNEVILSDSLLNVTLNKKQLEKGNDYTVSYVNNINQGTATVIIKGIGEYAGTKKATFKIKRTPVDMANVECSNKDSFKAMEFVKGGCTPYPILNYNGETLKVGTDYTVSYKNNKKTGSASVVVSGKGAFKGKQTILFTIAQKDISNVSIRTLNVPYTGKKNKYQSKPILTDTDGTLLKAGTDYTLTYSCEGIPLDKQSNPDEHAEITVTITGKGNYKGSATGTYKLEGISFSTARFTVKSKNYTGKPVILSPDDITSASIKIKGVNENLIYGKDYEIVSYSKNIKKGTATVVFSGIGRFSGERSIKFKIVNRNMNANQ